MKEANGYNPSKDPRLIDCKTECGNYKCYAKRYGLFAEKTCQNFVEPKPITNADRIRQMSDEELAQELYWLRLDALRLEGFEGQIETTDEILDWLKSPVEE